MELWKDIPNFEGLYQASTDGEIRSLEHIRKNGTGQFANKRKVLRSDGKIYNSINEAREDLGKRNAHITEVCQGKLKSVYGYGFSYMEG